MKKIFLYICLPLVFILVFVVRSKPVHINDYYYIYPQDEFGEGYYLVCKMGCESDPKIENITEVSWNKKVLIIYTDEEKSYLIKANGVELKCCNSDSLIGPMERDELEVLINQYNIGEVKNLKFK